MKRPTTTSSSGLYNSYQHGGNTNNASSHYQPPVFYAADQTQTLQDTTKTMFQADETAGAVLDGLQRQRQQIIGARDNATTLKEATDAARRELELLRQKYRAKKQKLYIWIVALGILDVLLFVRIVQCRGNFFC
jgi:hypothetical protein